jgi:hypothetical protein
MASGLRSLVNSAKKLALGSGSEAKVVDPTALFPKVDPAVDGEDCDHDCNSCVTHYPKGFSIDEEDELYGFVKGWSTHVLVATGKSDWVRDVADEKGSVMQAIGNSKVGPSNGVCFSSSTRAVEQGFSERAGLTALAAPDAFSVQHTHAASYERLLGTDNSASSTRFCDR